MAIENKSGNDERIELIVGNFLRAGVIIASVLVLIGGIVYLTKYGTDFPEYKIFSGEPSDLRGIHGIIKDAFSLRSRAIIQFGLLILMCTPGAWVAFLLFAFVKQRDRTYVIVAAIVLAVLLISLIGNHLHS